MAISNDPLLFPDHQPNTGSRWNLIKKEWNKEKTETVEEAIAKIRDRLGWVVFLLVMILFALNNIADKFKD
jgi:hypothetical protein